MAGRFLGFFFALGGGEARFFKGADGALEGKALAA
jgi:hypothetical protein